MQFIVYASPLNILGHNLIKGLQDLKNQIRMHAITDLPSLADHLRKPMGGESICVLIPGDARDLHELHAIRHLMRDMRLVLILPNRQAETVSDGHTLRPRFVSYADCPLADVTAVVRKMLDNARSLDQAVERTGGFTS